AIKTQPEAARTTQKCLLRNSRMAQRRAKLMPRSPRLAFAAKTWFPDPMRFLFLAGLVLFALATGWLGPVAAMTDWQWERRNSGSSVLPVRAEHYAEDVCRIIAREASRRVLPPDFLARLIWRESLFDPNAVSPKGAQGIAQFMPGTARERGLADPFLPHE